MKYIYKVDDRDLSKTGIYKITIGNHFYIGKTETSFRRRWGEHIRSFKNKTCNRRIKKILEQTSIIIFEIVQIITSRVCAWESCWINCFSHPDLNVIKPKCYGNNIRCVKTG